MSVKKTVLVCFGERKREVTFSSESEKEGADLEALLDEVKKVFDDVLAPEGITNKQLILQTKSEEWCGEFLDSRGQISDKSVVKVVLNKQIGEGGSGIKQDVSHNLL